MTKVAQQKIWPIAYISYIDSKGLMSVKFDRKMKVPDYPELIQNETVTLNDIVYPILEFTVVPGKYSEKS